VLVELTVNGEGYREAIWARKVKRGEREPDDVLDVLQAHRLMRYMLQDVWHCIEKRYEQSTYSIRY